MKHVVNVVSAIACNDDFILEGRLVRNEYFSKAQAFYSMAQKLPANYAYLLPEGVTI
jgi:hypothetical protein